MFSSQPPLRRIVLKEEYVLLLNDLVDALVLRQMEFWQRHVASFETYYKEELLRRDQMGQGSKSYGWVYKKSRQLAEEDFRKAISEDRVRRSLRRLVERGILDERRNPSPVHRYDKTLQYRLDLWQLRQQLEGSEAVRRVGYELPTWAEAYNGPALVPQIAASSLPEAGTHTLAAAAIPEKNKKEEEKYDNTAVGGPESSVYSSSGESHHPNPRKASRDGSPSSKALNAKLTLPADLEAWLDENATSPEKKHWLLNSITRQYVSKHGPETVISWLETLQEQLEESEADIQKFEAYILGALRNMHRENVPPPGGRVQPKPGREEVIPRRLAFRIDCQGDRPVYEAAEYEDGQIEFFEVGRAVIYTAGREGSTFELANIHVTLSNRKSKEFSKSLREDTYEWGGKRQPQISEGQKVGIFLMEEYKSSSWRKYRWPVDEQGVPLPAAWLRQPTGTRFTTIEQGFFGEEVVHWELGKDGEFIKLLFDYPPAETSGLEETVSSQE